jgi:hypothetical protein
MTCLTVQRLKPVYYIHVCLHCITIYTVFHFRYRQTSMATINKFDLMLPEIPYNGNKVILEYIFVNNTQYQLQTKTRIVDNEPASVEGKKIYYLLLSDIHTASRRKSKNWLARMRIMCPSEVTCHPRNVVSVS